MEDLKQARKSARTALTKKHTAIRRCMVDLGDDYIVILGSLRDEYMKLFRALEVANEAYLDALTADKSTQEDDLDKHEAYTATVTNEYIANLCEINKELGLKGTVQVPASVDPMQSAVLNMSSNLVNMAESMNRPRVNIAHFSGGPDLYEFLKSFDLAVGETSSFKYKLTVLNQFCKGEAQLAIRPCLKYQNEEEG